MQRFLLCACLSLSMLPFLGAGADAYYINSGTISYGDTPPVVDAVNFINNGIFNILVVSGLPYETSDTVNYTNNGSMSGIVGFKFETAPSGAGTNKWAANFYNKVNATVSAPQFGLPYTLQYGNGFAQFVPSYLLISASNIVNRGTLAIGVNGTLQLQGSNVDLTRSAVLVGPVQPTGSLNGIDTNWFQPDIGILDDYWGQTNMTFNSSTLVTLAGGTVTATSPLFGVQTAGGGGFARVSVSNPLGLYTNVFANDFYSLTNYGLISVVDSTGATNMVLVPTNIVRQAVFVGASDPNLGLQVLYEKTNPTNDFQTITVGLTTAITNVATRGNDIYGIYFTDQLAAEIGRGLQQNIITGNTYRPTNYVVSRALQFGGGPGNTTLYSNITQFLYNTNFTNAIVSGAYAGYSCSFQDLPTISPNVPVTNAPGQIIIHAGTLKLDNARFRTEGYFDVRATDFVSSSNTVVDGPSLSYSLQSTSGNLVAQNLAKPSVARFRGTISAWSAVWSNSFPTLVTNYTLDTTTSNLVYSPLTNNVNIGLHALILDATSLQSQVPVTVYDYALHSTNMLVKDIMNVVQSFLLDGQNFTLQGGITLSGSLNSWTMANAPSLLNFTNTGTLSIPNEAHFGDDRPAAYSNFVNTGTIVAGSLNIDSGYLENDGGLTAGGALFVQAGTAKLQNGSSSSGGDAHFSCGNLKFDNYQLSSGGSLELAATDSLSDAGAGSGSVLAMQSGFNLYSKPPFGDLLGTTFRSTAPNFFEVDHVWAGQDRGLSASGYTNNVAMGQLVLSSSGTSPYFFFTGAGISNGLYVDTLDLSSLGSNYLDNIGIDNNLVIYYAAAKLGFAPPPNAYGTSQEPEEYLDGQFGGHLRWVQSYAGPNSLVAVLINGQTYYVNKALRFSKIIDSDGDGVPNYYDLTPFGALTLTASITQTNQPSQKAMTISWNAAPNTVYSVEYSTSMFSTNWLPLLTYTNNAPTNGIVTVVDTNSLSSGSQRFYRIHYSP